MANPFNDLIEAMREEGRYYNEPSFYFATVTSSYPNLKVKFNDLEIVKSQLLIDKWILDRNGLESSLKDILAIGDRVVLVMDGEKFVIMSKVVSI